MKGNAAFTQEEAKSILASLTYEEKLLLREILLAIKSERKAAS